MRFLIADDQKDFATLLARTIVNAGYEVAEVVTSGGLSVMRAYTRCQPDVVLMDFMMPQFNGLTAARHILSKDPDACIILMSGLPDVRELRASAIEMGAFGLLQKPFTPRDLEELLGSVSSGPAVLPDPLPVEATPREEWPALAVLPREGCLAAG
jgi:CheY-like chemotaxis protein